MACIWYRKTNKTLLETRTWHTCGTDQQTENRYKDLVPVLVRQTAQLQTRTWYTCGTDKQTEDAYRHVVQINKQKMATDKDSVHRSMHTNKQHSNSCRLSINITMESPIKDCLMGDCLSEDHILFSAVQCEGTAFTGHHKPLLF